MILRRSLQLAKLKCTITQRKLDEIMENRLIRNDVITTKNEIIELIEMKVEQLTKK